MTTCGYDRTTLDCIARHNLNCTLYRQDFFDKHGLLFSEFLNETGHAYRVEYIGFDFRGKVAVHYITNGIMKSTSRYDDSGRLIEVANYSQDGGPISTVLFYKNGIVKTEYFFDKCGNRMLKWNYSEQGILMSKEWLQEGFIERAMQHDD